MAAHPLEAGRGADEEEGAGMTDEQRQSVAQEDYLRALYATARTSPALANPYGHLLDVFACRETFRYAPMSAAEARIPRVLTKWWPTSSPTGCAVVEEPEFTRRWDVFTGGVFRGMDWTHVFAAGGAVLAALLPEDFLPPSASANSDIDLFVWGVEEARDADAVLEQIYRTVVGNVGDAGRGHVVRTNRAVTILGDYPYRHVQIILRLFAAPAEVLLGFDLDACTVGFDGKRVWAAPRFQRAVTRRYNLLNPARRSFTYEVSQKTAALPFIVTVLFTCCAHASFM
jgi:hypothetical protein